ncbi:acyl-CoA dehydrogenase family protein [Actinomycetospora sp. TBRC 11914]|uniref:acyl-CoA dehydrogenase family protein n=1 Tax=Actinomycetospora sp. TBRC 11914 TaxID=2729387 RepID=UPI001B7D75A4|nr:acyl-CoA dehydrogenase family protein [Actinomycetospora sp. TBRC 11914]
MTATAVPPPLLADDLLDTLARRAADHDRSGEFVTQDVADLAARGYLRAPVPVELGGAGLRLDELARLHRALATRAPATALAMGMHLFWVGAAADRFRAGDDSLAWVLHDAAAGEVFAAGHSEPGNDLGLADSVTRAEPDADGGYTFHGRKVFSSLSPVWTRLGVHGRDDTDLEAPAVVHAVITRDAPGYRIEPTWDALGMRATRSDSTVLDGVRAEPGRVLARVAPGPPSHPYLVAVPAWATLLTATVYAGIARRALDLAVAAAQERVSTRRGGSTRAHDPYVSWTVADAVIELDGIEAHLDAATREWSHDRPGGLAWTTRLFSAKVHAVEGAKRVVDLALQVTGGRSMQRGQELERLYRDVRAGGFHNPTVEVAHEALGAGTLLAARPER